MTSLCVFLIPINDPLGFVLVFFCIFPLSKKTRPVRVKYRPTPFFDSQAHRSPVKKTSEPRPHSIGPHRNQFGKHICFLETSDIHSYTHITILSSFTMKSY